MADCGLGRHTTPSADIYNPPFRCEVALEALGLQGSKLRLELGE